MGRRMDLGRAEREFEAVVDKAIKPIRELVADLRKQIETSDDTEEAIELLISALKQLGVDNDTIQNLQYEVSPTKQQTPNVDTD